MKKVMKHVLVVAALVLLCVVGVGVATTGHAAATIVYSTSTTTPCDQDGEYTWCEQTTTVERSCTQAHPCTPEECAEVGAHGGDCLPPETTTTVTQLPKPPCPNGSDGNAGHDGQPGNDDCAITQTPPPETTTTTATTTTPTTTTETTTSTPTTTTEQPTVKPPKAPKPRGSRPADEHIAQHGTLPSTGMKEEIAALVGTALLLLGLGLVLVARRLPLRTTS